MTLDRQFRKEFEEIIEDYISIKTDQKHTPRLNKIWKIEHNEFEFLYGETIGYLTGMASGMIIGQYKRDVSTDETNEIFEIVESYASKIRESLNVYKT